MKVSEIKNFIDTKEFFADIDRVVREYETNPIDAVIHYCSDKDIELDIAATLIRSNTKFKKRLQEDGIELNLIDDPEQ